MSGMCMRCHFNVPFAPGEDFCLDCEADVEMEIEKLLRERKAALARDSRSLSASDLREWIGPLDVPAGGKS